METKVRYLLASHSSPFISEKMTQAELETLEQKVLHPDKWEEAMPYFFDHFGTLQAFLDLSERTSLPIVLTMLGQIGKVLFQKEAVSLLNPSMFKVKTFNMLHGSCIIENKLVAFVYLMNIHKGVFSISNLETLKMEHCSRVSALPIASLDDDGMYQEPWNANPN
jgi:hypothetical protein